MQNSNSNKYELLAQTMLDEIGYVVDPENSELLYVNDTLLNLYGLTREEIIGQKYFNLICGGTKPCDFCKNFDLSKVKENSFSKIYHYNQYNKLHLALKVKYQVIDGKRYLIATGIDISTEYNKRNELELLSNLDRNIIKCANTLLSKSGQSMFDLMQILTDYYNASRAYIYQINSDNISADCIVEYYADPNATHNIDKTIPFGEDLSLTKLLYKNDYVYSDNLSDTLGEDSIEYKILNSKGVSNFLIIPLKKNDKFFGFIGVDGLTANQNEPKLLMSVTAFVVDNIYKNKALEELEKTKLQLDDTYELSQTIAECAKFLLEDEGTENSINALLKTVTEFYGSEVAYIFEIDSNERVLRNNFSYISPGSNFIKIEDIDQNDLLDWVEVVKERNMFHLSDVETLKNAVEYEFLKSLGVNSMLLVPLTRDGKRTGILGCDNLTKNFDRPDLLHTLSGFIMNDVEKKELISELEVLSYTDKLTGLYNRNFYLQIIENKKSNPASEMGVIFADVNGLKKANDNLGHEYGDTLLKWCANYLKKNINTAICRIGGDEFVCFCENIPEIEFELCVSSMRSELKKMSHQCMSIGSPLHAWTLYTLHYYKQEHSAYFMFFIRNVCLVQFFLLFSLFNAFFYILFKKIYHCPLTAPKFSPLSQVKLVLFIQPKITIPNFPQRALQAVRHTSPSFLIPHFG